MVGTTRASRVETLRFRDGRIEMIDQRVLPARFDYIACNSAQEVAGAIRSMVVRGAPAIGCAAAYGIALEAKRLKDLPREGFAAGMEQAFDLVAQSRPTAVNLFWALQRMRRVLGELGDLPAADIVRHLIEEAHTIL
ncbi:MAG: S-methyl-5-thioribose-1-phosphate isomerase, partial [Gammaproteobacteria bacterium]